MTMCMPQATGAVDKIGGVWSVGVEEREILKEKKGGKVYEKKKYINNNEIETNSKDA